MYQIYQVKNNETLNDVARIFNTTIDELKQINGFANEILVNGQYVIVPTTQSEIFDTYIVKKGDNLYSIATTYNTSYKELMKLNGMNENDYLYPNQEIIVPKKDTKYHITTDGETLEKVAEILQIDSVELIDQNKNIYLLPEQLIIYKRYN